jgi:hypothetical protein
VYLILENPAIENLEAVFSDQIPIPVIDFQTDQ